MKNKTVSVHGSYFEVNYGDILLVNMFSNWIKEVDREITINLPMVDKNKIPEMPDGTTGLINLIKSEKLVFCGGGYFGEKPSNKKKWAIRNFYRHGIVALIAIIFKVPYVFIGVEFGPISTAWFRRITIYIAKHAKYILVRNQESKEFLESNGVKDVKVAVDAVLSLSDTVIIKNTSNIKKPLILLHLSEVSQHANQYGHFIDVLSVCLKQRFEEFEVQLITDTLIQKGNFDCILDCFSKNGITCGFHGYVNTNDLIDTINRASYVFTSKLHVGITAAALNKPVFSFYTHPKTPRLHRQIENADFCVSLNEANSTIDANFISKFLDRAVYELPQECLFKARKNKEVVQSFII